MFLDGLQYATISKNLAHGEGTFWHPHLSETWNKSGNEAFLEHPPLVFGIQSLFFRLLGDSRFVERFYSFLTSLITALLIIAIWRLIFRDKKHIRELEWFPVMLWIIIPICFWSYQNNMQENTMGIFTLGAVYAALKAITVERYSVLNFVLSGTLIALAFLSKGLPGLFPFAMIPLYGIIHPETGIRKTVLFSSIILLTTTLLLVLIIFPYPAARESMTFWITERVLGRIAEDRTTSNRFDVIWRVFTELIPSLILVCGIMFSQRKQLRKDIPVFAKDAIFFILVGLSATLPMVFTMVQKGFYLVPGFPFLALGLALLCVPSLEKIFDKIHNNSLICKFFGSLSIVMLIAAIAFSVMQVNKFSRDENDISDVYKLGRVIEPQSTVGADVKLYNNWPFQLYMLRYFDISIEPNDLQSLKFYIAQKGDSTSVPENYQKLKIDGLTTVDLYRKSEPNQAIH